MESSLRLADTIDRRVQASTTMQATEKQHTDQMHSIHVKDDFVVQMNLISRNLHSLLRLVSGGTNAPSRQYRHQQSMQDAMANPLSNDDEFVSSLKMRIEHKIKQLEECASGSAQEILYSVVNEPVEIKKQVLSLLEAASLCAPSQEMQQFNETMKTKVHLASRRALRCFDARIECDEGVFTISFLPAQPAEVALGTPSPAANTGQGDSVQVAPGRTSEPATLRDEPRDQEERHSEMSFNPSSSSESEAQDSEDEPLILRGREKANQTKRPAASTRCSRGNKPKRRRCVTPEESQPLSVLEKHQIGDMEYTFELPYKSDRIWVLRCPICPDHRFKANCLINPNSLAKHCEWTEKGGKDKQKRHRRFMNRFEANSAYLVRNCIFEGTPPSQQLPAAGSLTQIVVVGAGFNWALVQNAKGGLANMNPRNEKMAANFADVELPDRKPDKRQPQQPQPTKAAPKQSTPSQNQTVPDQEDQGHAQPMSPPIPPPRRDEDEIRVVGHRVSSSVTCDGQTVKVEPPSSEEE